MILKITVGCSFMQHASIFNPEIFIPAHSTERLWLKMCSWYVERKLHSWIKAKKQILSATSLLYVPLSGPRYEILLSCVSDSLSQHVFIHWLPKKDTNICLNRHAGNRFKMEPLYLRGPLTGESADTQQYQLCQNTRGGGGARRRREVEEEVEEGGGGGTINFAWTWNFNKTWW